MSSVIKPLRQLGYTPISARLDFEDLVDIEIPYGDNLLQLLDGDEQVTSFTLLTEQKTEFSYTKKESGEDARWELYSIKLPDDKTLKMKDINGVPVKPKDEEPHDAPEMKSRSS